MPKIYLSPSTQEFNPYYDGVGSEEYYMNLVADAMEPYLTASGIAFDRNTPDMTAASSIVASNAADYDLHVSLHSNASPVNLAGQLRGIDAYYSPISTRGQYLADLMVQTLTPIYPLPDRVQTRPTTALGEVTKTRAPSVLLELGYHDNPQDAAWIRANIEPIAQAVTRGITDYFGLPLVSPTFGQQTTVNIAGGTLNLRDRPGFDGNILFGLPKNTKMEVLGEQNGWYAVRVDGVDGYVRSEFVTLG